MIGNNEVTITEPAKMTRNFMSNPAKIFTLYNRDFKYRYVRETTLNGLNAMKLIFIPKNLNQPYSRIKIFVNQKNDMP